MASRHGALRSSAEGDRRPAARPSSRHRQGGCPGVAVSDRGAGARRCQGHRVEGECLRLQSTAKNPRSKPVATPFEEWLEGVRSAMAAPPLSRSDKSRPGADEKWVIGDALLAVPAEHRDEVATAAGLDRNSGRSYWRTALAWPPNTRSVPASWATYRELVPMQDRFTVIQPAMNVRQAHFVRTGKSIDRPALHRSSDDQVIEELVRLMLSPRRGTVVPEILRRLNMSREGRKAARDRRSAAALRRLDEEIRLVQKEIKRLRERSRLASGSWR